MNTTVPELILGVVLALGITAIAGYWLNRSGVLGAVRYAVERWIASRDVEHRRVEIWAEGFMEGQELERSRAYASMKKADEA